MTPHIENFRTVKWFPSQKFCGVHCKNLFEICIAYKNAKIYGQYFFSLQNLPTYWTATDPQSCNKIPFPLPPVCEHRKVLACSCLIDPRIMAGSPEVAFLFQFGNLRDIVTTNVGSLTLSKLKDLACEFINSKVSGIHTASFMCVDILKRTMRNYHKSLCVLRKHS